jgi:hypothetical protein
MTKGFWLSTIALAVSLMVAAPVAPLKAEGATTTSVAKKKYKKHRPHVVVHRRHVVRSRSAYPELEPYRSNGFKGEFPGSCAYDRAAGNCMIDLGYGRCEPCSIGGGGGRF